MKLTAHDRKTLAAIQECGFVGMNADGEPYLESSKTVSPFRVNRLVALGLLLPSGDTLFDRGGHPHRLIGR